jgi:hypothetical protein
MFNGCAVGEGANQVLTLNCIFPLIANLIYFLIFFAGFVALIMIIISGIRFITSGGDAKALSTANKTWFYSLTGLLLVFLAFLILNTIATITHVACLSDWSKGIPTFQSCGTIGVAGGSGGGTPINCGDANPSGNCPSGQTCNYDPVSGHNMCQQIPCGVQNGYCGTGTCVYVIGSSHWVCQ